MKKLLILFLIFISINSLSQSKEIFYSKLSNPNSKNELSRYLKAKIPKRLLRKARFFRDQNNITLTFYINKENKPYRITINSYGNELRKKIEDAFYNYPLEKLNLNSIDSKKKYSLQIISKDNSRNVFNASSVILEEKVPATDECFDLDFYQDKDYCLREKIETHFYNSIDFSLSEAIKSDDKIVLNLKLIIDENGNLLNNGSKIPSVFKNELDSVIKSFPKLKENKSTQITSKYSYSFSISFFKDELPIKDLDKNQKSKKLTNPNPENNLSQFFRQNLSKNFPEISNLNRQNNTLTLSFEIDKNDVPYNIKTNSRSRKLENQIISVFKKYPIQKLNFLSKKTFNSYVLQILSFTDNKIIINTDSFIGNERLPIYPGCEQSKSIKDLKKCFNKEFQKHLVKSFDANLPNKLGLPKGKKRLFIFFKVDKNGDIIDVRIKAPRKKLKDEIKRILYATPKITPAEQLGKNVDISFTIPLTIMVN